MNIHVIFSILGGTLLAAYGDNLFTVILNSAIGATVSFVVSYFIRRWLVKKKKINNRSG